MRTYTFRDAFACAFIAQSGPAGYSAAAIGKALGKYGSFVDRDPLGART
jgi:hypothetical protein